MALLGGLTTTDTAKAHTAGEGLRPPRWRPSRMLAMSLDAQLHLAMTRMQAVEEATTEEDYYQTVSWHVSWHVHVSCLVNR